MDILIFSEFDWPIAKALREDHTVVTAWPIKQGICDISYDPERDSVKDLENRFPRSFSPQIVIITNLEYVSFLWGLHDITVPKIAMVSDTNTCFEIFLCAQPFIDLYICNEDVQRSAFQEYLHLTRKPNL